MQYNVLPKVEHQFKNADQKPYAPISETELFHHMLRLAIDECHDPNPIIRENARWWIFKDKTEGVDSSGGYISFQGACEILGINAEWARGALEKSNGNNGHRRPGPRSKPTKHI